MSAAFDAWRTSGRHFAFRGHQIFWQAGGDGSKEEVLVCIHGFPSASWDWHALWPALCQRFSRVIAPDMLGFGWSDKPRDHIYSLHEQADLHEQLLRAESVRRCHILAHDYGVSVAQELLARHQERQARGDDTLAIESVCLLNGGLFPESHRPRLIQKLLRTPVGPLLAALISERSFARSFAAVFGPDSKPDATAMHEFWQLLTHRQGQRIMHRLIRYIDDRRAHRERWVSALQTTTAPLRLINGPVDPVSGLHMVQRYRELIPSPDAVLLPGIGHYPQLEDPAGTWAAFAAFHYRLASRSS